MNITLHKLKFILQKFKDSQATIKFGTDIINANYKKSDLSTELSKRSAFDKYVPLRTHFEKR